ncbi:integrase, catalytic region, zinc finger, CCHC-type containing protein [Tanacetum coccineum]
MNLKSVENEDLKAQNQDKVFVITSLKNNLRKLKGKEIVENVVHTPSATTITPGTFKLNLELLPPRLLQNREVHIDYLRNTQEQANILREIVEQANAKQPLDSELNLACKYDTRIKDLLVYVQDTCPNAIIPSAKKVTVKPMNNVKKVRFAEPLTSSSNIKQVKSSNTPDSNTPVLSSAGVKCSTSNCGSKPPGNKRNDRILQAPSRNKKNKVEAQPRKVNKVNHVVKPICDVDVKHSLLKANSEILCATCNKSMFFGVHDKCLLDLVKNGNKRFKWKPTGRIFTIVGNSCPLTRITLTNVVPPKQTTSHLDEIQKPEIKVYSRKPKNVKNIGSSKIAKIVESKNANHSEPNQIWGSTAIDIPSSSSLVMTCFPDCTLVSGLRLFETHDRESLLAHELLEPKNFKEAMTEPSWIDAMQEEIHEFERLEVWELVPFARIDAIRISKHYVAHKEYDNLPYGRQNGFLEWRAQEEDLRAVDPTLFTRHAGNDILLVQIYVDDIIFASTNTAMCDEFANQMTNKFKMSMMGKMSFFLELQISQSPRGIFINQSKYASKIVKKYGLYSTDSVDSPMIENKKLDEDLQGKPVDATLYHGMIGSLMYLTSTRPDLNYVVCLCARYQAKPTEKHLQAVKRIF